LAQAINKLLQKIKCDSEKESKSRSAEAIDDNTLDETDELVKEIGRAGAGRAVPLSMVSLDYVNTLLDEDTPNARVLQCWTEQSICFIQTAPDDAMPDFVQDLA